MTTSDVTRTEAPPSTRLHGLDALRGGALLLGIVLHSLMPFLPGGWWPIADSRTSGVAMAMVATIHSFRMVLFMMLAGYFGRMVLHRRGTQAYLRDRGLRILLPLIVLGPLTLVSLVAVIELNRVVRGVPIPATPPGTDTSVASLLLVAPGHLWFLAVVVQCVVITVVARIVLVRVVGAERLAAWAARVGQVLVTPVVGVLVAAVPYLASMGLTGFTDLSGVPTPTTVLPEPAPVVGFLGAFLVGWCLHARGDAAPRLARAWPWHLGTAVVLTTYGIAIGAEQLPAVVQAAIVALTGWTWTFGLLGACVRFLHRESGSTRYLADASYWMYLLHLPLLMVVEVYLADLAWPIVVKVVIAWVICGVVLLLSYDLLVRDTWVGRWLNGRRRPSRLLSGSASAEGR